MKVIVIKANRNMKVEDLRKLHTEISAQLPTRVLLLPLGCEYDIVDLDIDYSESDPGNYKRWLKVDYE